MSTALVTVLYLAAVGLWIGVWVRWAQRWPTWAHVLIHVGIVVVLFATGKVGAGWAFTAWLALIGLVGVREWRAKHLTNP